ncbi:hypothetical protein ZWY2020_024110 [Hordeum vulgare]|nr:hypothetical protein ZWY2020_024110 [Hordeum vulgare]
MDMSMSSLPRLLPTMASSASNVLRLGGNGNPRTLRLFASLVEAESRRFTYSVASQPTENNLVRVSRGGATPTIPIVEFLERLE